MAKYHRPNQFLLVVACVMLGVTLDRIFLGMHYSAVVENENNAPPFPTMPAAPGEEPHNLRTTTGDGGGVHRRKLLLGLGLNDPKTVELRTPDEQQPQLQQQFVASDVANSVEFNNNDDNNIQQHQQQQQFAPPAAVADPQYSDAITRDVHVGTMCRCPSNELPVPGGLSESGFDTEIVQPPSKATGPVAKRFVMHPPVNPNNDGGGTAAGNADDVPWCQCLKNHQYAEPTYDMNLEHLNRLCPDDVAVRWKNVEIKAKEPLRHGKYEYDAMPDLGVEERLPLFMGVLSFESPLSLNFTLHNWRELRLFEWTNARDVFVQMNHMSELDENVIRTHNELLGEANLPGLTPMGSPEDNLHPGLAMAKFCRAAEAHPSSHPNGENLLLFVEKDWVSGNRFRDEAPSIFRSINALMQRGVHVVRFQPPSIPSANIKKAETKFWNCPSQGYGWKCSTAHQHRWANQPLVVDCKWFLRYLEPFALLDDPIMFGCRPGMREAGYCDWEQALGDGRVAWTNSQWVMAHLPEKRKFWHHHEVDQ